MGKDAPKGDEHDAGEGGSKPSLQGKRCSYSGCENPESSRQFIKIDSSCTSAGRQDWSKLDGMVLCCTCYDRYRYSGSLERTKSRPLEESERRCSNTSCDGRSTRFRKIDKTLTAGGRDWGPVVGMILCQTCYERFKTRGCLERSTARLPKPLKNCTNEACLNQGQSRLFKIKEGKMTDGRDWSPVVGHELCNSCYERFRTTGNLKPGGVPINPLPLPASAAVDASAFQQDSSLLAQGFPLRTFDARNLLVGAQMQPLAAYQQLRLLGLQNALSLSFAPQLVPDAIPNALHGAAGMAAGPGMGMMNPAAGMPGRAGWDVQLPMPVPLHGGSAAPQQAAQAVQAAQGGVGRKQEGAAGQKQAPEREEDGDEEERASKRAKGGP